MADKPSRALVLYGDGLARGITSSHTHLHSLASKASCGFLSLPISPLSESEEERVVREFAVLLDAFDNSITERSDLVRTLSERFMGMKATLITGNADLKSFGTKLGFSVLEINQLSSGASVLELLKLLGFEEGNVLDTIPFDLVFVHVSDDVEFVNALVGSVMHIAQPGTVIGSRLHLSVVMSYGHVTEADASEFSVLRSKDEVHPQLSAIFPRQSYTMRGEKPRNDVRHHSPMLVAQWQDAVTRMDMAETFSFEDFEEHGGNLVIPADRFLHEVAFKLWKALKLLSRQSSSRISQNHQDGLVVDS